MHSADQSTNLHYSLGSHFTALSTALFHLFPQLNASSKGSINLLGTWGSKELHPPACSPGTIWHCSSPSHTDIKEKGPPLRGELSLQP